MADGGPRQALAERLRRTQAIIARSRDAVLATRARINDTRYMVARTDAATLIERLTNGQLIAAATGRRAAVEQREIERETLRTGRQA